MSEKIKIVVATHINSEMPTEKIYLPLHVGSAGKTNLVNSHGDYSYVRDDSGENISDKNSNFGTQTGLYWVWKNIEAEYKGLVHYRRYFVGNNVDKQDMISSVLTESEIIPFLGEYKVFVPKKRRYFIESLYSHYAHTHDGTHFTIVEDIIKKDCPEYYNAYKKVLKRTWGYMFNMMILKTELMDDYCLWLFNILFQVDGIVDKERMSAFDSRFCGRISEILFNVWLEKNLEEKTIKKSEIKELPYLEKVNWNYKIKAYLSAKFMGKKYGRSS